jgi:hypothetical protein
MNKSHEASTNGILRRKFMPQIYQTKKKSQTQIYNDEQNQLRAYR